MHNHDIILEASWHKSVPLKVSNSAWRLFPNRWLTKVNLVRWGVITVDTQLCVSGCGQNETIDHLIIHCPIFGNLWQLIMSWLGVYYVDPQEVTYHFYQFVPSSGGYAPRRSFLHLIWLCCIWVLWMKGTIYSLLIKLKQPCNSWKRLRLHHFGGWKLKMCFLCGYHMWWQHPLVCLGIGWCFYFFIFQFVLQDWLCNFVLFFRHSLC